MKKSARCLLPACAIAAAALGLLAGCEEGNVTNASFTITPANVTLTASQTTVVLAAVGGVHPLTWTVTDESRGAVSGSGQTVTYTRTAANGVNLVEVTDGRGWLAAATIVQNADPTAVQPLTVTPAAPSLAANGDVVQLAVAGGSPPYDWSINDATLGHFVTTANQGATVVYMRDHAGSSILTVTDNVGTSAVVIVQQP